MRTWEQIYDITVKTLCEKPIEDFDMFITLEMPDFMEKGIGYFEEGHEDQLSSMRLHKELAKDKDYKEFVEYMYNYIGDDIHNYIDENEIVEVNK